MSKYETVDEAKKALLLSVKEDLQTRGVSQHSTCPTGGAFGWDMMAHYALEWFLRHPPEGWHISRIFKFECYDWTITEA